MENRFFVTLCGTASTTETRRGPNENSHNPDWIMAVAIQFEVSWALLVVAQSGHYVVEFLERNKAAAVLQFVLIDSCGKFGNFRSL